MGYARLLGGQRLSGDGEIRFVLCRFQLTEIFYGDYCRDRATVTGQDDPLPGVLRLGDDLAEVVACLADRHLTHPQIVQTGERSGR